MDSIPWRLVIDSPGHGAWNMAVDEAILEAAGRKDVPPTLRLYGWEPPCLSLGYSQPVADSDQEALRQRGWELVRRPTGGRAILHTDELTYAVIAPPDEPRVAGSVLESYRRLSQALLAALRELGLPATADEEYTQAAAISRDGAVCFERPSNYEITVNGKKLIGSAQARRWEGVLQHGSLPLTGDLTRITQALVYPTLAARAQAAERLLQRATTVEMALGRLVTWDEAAVAFEQGFARVLDIRFTRSLLTSAETERAAELVRVKFDHPDWTGKV